LAERGRRVAIMKDQTAAIVEKAYDARRVAVASKAMIFGSGIFP